MTTRPPRTFNTDAERTAYLLGARDEAHLRETPRKALPRDVREILDYLDALAKHDPDSIATPGATLERLVYVFRSHLTRHHRRAIRRLTRTRSR